MCFERLFWLILIIGFEPDEALESLAWDWAGGASAFIDYFEREE